MIWLLYYDSHIVLLRSALLSKRLQAGEKMKTERFSLKHYIEDQLFWLIGLIGLIGLIIVLTPVLYILSFVWLFYINPLDFFGSHSCSAEQFYIKIVHSMMDIISVCAFLYLWFIHWIIGVIGKIVETIFGIIVLSCIVIGIPVFCYLKIKDYLNKCHQSNFTKGDKK